MDGNRILGEIMFYSKSTNGFYDIAIHGGNIPEDAVEITSAEHAALLQAQSEGKLIMATAQGSPIAVLPIPPTLPEIKSAKLAQLTAAYNAAIQHGVTYTGTTFQADTASQQVLTASLAAGAVPAGFAWLDLNNVKVPMTYAELQGLAGVMLAQGNTAFWKLQGLKQEVRDAVDVAGVDLVVWA